MICEKCGREFFDDWRKDKKTRSETSCRFCSRSCSNGRQWTTLQKKEMSDILKKSKKVKMANTLRSWPDKINKKCPVCGKRFTVRQSEKKRIYCSRKCFKKDNTCHYRIKCSGGVRERSGRSISGKYNGFYCGSTWELCYYIFISENNIDIKRCMELFEYVDENGEVRKYNPDFVVNGRYVEIKGPQDKKWEYKLKCFPHKEKIDILYKEDIKFYINYVKEKYKVKKVEFLYDIWK